MTFWFTINILFVDGFFFLLQDAIKHNSYITEERKIEKGDIEKGFKSADEIIEGSSYI